MGGDATEDRYASDVADRSHEWYSRAAVKARRYHREAVEAERRLFHTGAVPYDDPVGRDQVLAQNITSIEQKEMSSWLKIAGPRRHSRGNPA
ncbi:hypothetical protein [Nocardia niwae]|uniref:Uncharacterized protein n=1 Tax=Nocardia niwae TaxID=626084 RepID=A0ABV2XE90_9NOCA